MNRDAPPAPSADPAEALWVQAELIRGLMRTAGQWQYASIAVIPLLLAVLWPYASPGLALWLVFAAGVSLARFGILREYTRVVMAGGMRQHVAFFNRFWLIWPASGMVWGLTVALHFDRVALESQFICWLLVVAMTMLAVTPMSHHLPTLRAYLAGAVVPALIVMVWRVLERGFDAPGFGYWLLVMVFLHWYLLRRTGALMHSGHEQNLKLQYRNIQLIESLTRQTQAALEAVAVKNGFMASAAHDLRQPVHALGLYADWLRSEPELVHELAPKIFESTRAVNALFDSMFDLVRLDSGKARLDVQPVDIGRLLHDLCVQYTPMAMAKGLELRLHLAPGTAIVQSDAIMLQRIVGNLVSNAIRYTVAGGVLLALRRRACGCSIEVWDTGVGIAPEFQREVFREFFKVPLRSGTQEGFGLGLSIVARLTHILGHPISLVSRVGRGTVVRLRLVPTDAEKAARRASPAQLASIP